MSEPITTRPVLRSSPGGFQQPRRTKARAGSPAQGPDRLVTPGAVVRRFEQRFLPLRTPVAALGGWVQYQDNVLPPLSDTEAGFAQQCFTAGWDAAVAEVRGVLIPIQSEVLRDGRK